MTLYSEEHLNTMSLKQRQQIKNYIFVKNIADNSKSNTVSNSKSNTVSNSKSNTVSNTDYKNF